MRFGRSWSVKKMRPEARAIAEQAALKAGLPLEDWLHSVIVQQAGQTGAASPPLTDDAFHGGEFAAVNNRLDNLSQRIDRITGTGPAAYAPKRTREVEQSSAPPLAPESPGVRLPPSLDRAMAEIAARQRTLSGRSQAPSRQPAAASEAPLQPALPAQNLAGLEEQLRTITSQIETLRKPGVEEAINALRHELAEIGRTLAEAMPRRALEAIERQIQNLDQRIVESRQAGIDAGALVGIERGLAEVRDAMHGLMPAENLIGYTDAVASLAHKIDLIVAQNDPAKIAQLEHAVTTLRELSNHIASDETVRGLAEQVYALSEKIELMAQSGGGAGDGALNHLEQRIAMLSDSLAERTHDGGVVSPRLETLVASLAEKIDQLQHTPSQGGLGQLEDYIVKLVTKLDASDAKLGHLEGIERGLADLLVGIEAMRTKVSADGPRAQETQDVDHIRVGIARTQDTLDAVHGTLGHVVERLTTIERDIRGRPQAAADLGAAATRPAYVDDAPSIAAPIAPSAEGTSGPIAPPTQRRLPATAQLPSDPDLPDNQPLEPGSGRPSVQSTPAARIAASQAALGSATGAAAPGGKSSFIAAARRAAQAAGNQPNARAKRMEGGADSDLQPSLRDKMMKRVKTLFIAASIIAIVIGLVQVAGTVFQFGSPLITLADAPPTVPAEETKTVDLTVHEPEPEATGSIAATPLAPPDLPPIGPLAPAGSSPLAINPLSAAPAPPAIPSLFAPPVFPPKGDVTGSIPHPAVTAPVARPAPPAPPASAAADRLPAAIGGPKLRSAALGGDAAAAYAVALRFAEGRGVPANMEEAAFWYERAASKGLVPAQFRYASLLEKGLGVKKDLAQARRLYLAAAGKGNSKAMHNLAVLYAEGIDGKPDYATAVQWFRKAAQHGVADSQYNLGVLCARGLGTDQNYAEALKWFTLAAANGDGEAAKKRDDVAAQLDPAALAAAQQAIKSFVPQQQPQDAVTVHEPAGGWDHAAAAPGRANPRSGPLAFNAGQTGKR
ncbi:MAG TPA: hypothetical protein VFW22_08305 [Pseudolabrys sp.]|nr:hypothetical protein [Pseudolabrys sp.]